jgi:hypothetical protein
MDDAHMLEHALDSSYTESWRLVEGSDGRFLALRLERAKRVERVLVISGDRFVYARNRARDLPIAESLVALIASSKATRPDIIAYLDCELSVGRVRGGAIPWEIQHSTLPWREGRHLGLADSIAVSNRTVTSRGGDDAGKGWTVSLNTFAKGELESIFANSK